MLDQLIKLVKENAGDAIIKNPAIPNQKNDAAIDATAASILSNLKGMAAGGNLDQVMNIFKGGAGASASPMVNNLTSDVAADLMKKFNLDQAAAGTIVKQLVPLVMNQLVKKTNDPADSSIDLQGVLGALTGGKAASGKSGLLGGLLGLFGRK